MKSIFLTAGLWIIMPVAVFAQGVDQATIAQLQAQIQALQNQIKQIQQQSILPTLPQKPIVGSIRESSERVVQNIPNFTRDLFFGMKNNSEVSDLQEFLTDQGFYAGPISGNFGLLTLSSVKKFQSAHGIKPTGYFGPRSRAIANEIVQKLVGQICPREEGCEGDILPVERISITAEDALEGVVGEDLAISFKASGGSGNYEMDAENRIPGDFKVGISACQTGTVCFRDKITLSGIPKLSGVYDVVILARDTAPSTDFGIAYGKERFTAVIKDKVISGKLPVISGVKGPTTLKVGEEGIWTINAYDPHNGNLSYRVVWGDEAFMRKEGMTPSAPQATAFRQTATFSHIYSVASIYQPIFSVVNDRGLGAKISVSVQVNGIIEVLPPIPVPTGNLNIDPSSAVLKVGDSVRIKAIFAPPRPACLDASPPCGIPERTPYEVDASFVSDNPKVAAVETAISTCAVPPSGVPTSCPLPLNSVRGISAGDTIITASYTENRRTHAAKMKVTVAATQPSITLLSPNGRETYQIGDSMVIRFCGNDFTPATPGGLASISLTTGNVITLSPVVGIISNTQSGITACKDGGATAYTWKVGEFLPGVLNQVPPGGLQAGSNYRISVDYIAIGGGTIATADKSDAPFSIIASSTPVSVMPSNAGLASTLVSLQAQLDAIAVKVRELR